jgi:hypothetical protein
MGFGFWVFGFLYQRSRTQRSLTPQAAEARCFQAVVEEVDRV